METLFVVTGREADPNEAIAHLFAAAIGDGLVAWEWRLGFAAHRALIGARDDRPWAVQRREECYGIGIRTNGLGWTIQLLACGQVDGRDGEFHIYEWKAGKK